MTEGQLSELMYMTGYELNRALSEEEAQAWLTLLTQASNEMPMEKEHAISIFDFCERAGLSFLDDDHAIGVTSSVLSRLMDVSAWRSDESNTYRHALVTWYGIEGDTLRYSLAGAFLHKILSFITRSN